MTDIFADTRRDKRDKEHAKNPQPGDYWHEMYVPVCVVLAVAAGVVIYCEKARDVGDDKWTWDLRSRSTKTLEEFDRWLAYGSIAGYWASVEPEAHKWASDKAS